MDLLSFPMMKSAIMKSCRLLTNIVILNIKCTFCLTLVINKLQDIFDTDNKLHKKTQIIKQENHPFDERNSPFEKKQENNLASNMVMLRIG